MKVHWIVRWALASDPIAAFGIWVQETSGGLMVIIDEKTVTCYTQQVDAALKQFPWGVIARVILSWQRWNYWRRINQEPF